MLQAPAQSIVDQVHSIAVINPAHKIFFMPHYHKGLNKNSLSSFNGSLAVSQIDTFYSKPVQYRYYQIDMLSGCLRS